jgi:hypothetical protein
VTGDDHNTDALIAALRSPALPAERTGEAAAVTAMLGALARIPASTRFRAGRGIAIAVVTVASLGVGGLAAAGPWVFQAAAHKARSLVTADSAGGSEDAQGAANRADPLSGLLPRSTNAVGTIAPAAESAAALEVATGGDCSAAPCGVGTVPAVAVRPTAPPPQCADGTHGGSVSELTDGSVPPSSDANRGTNVAIAAQSVCTPPPNEQGSGPAASPNKPEDVGGGPPTSLPTPEPPPPPVTAPPVTVPPRPPTGPPASTPGQGNGQGLGSGQNQPPSDSPRAGDAGAGRQDAGSQGGQGSQATQAGEESVKGAGNDG